MSLERMSDAEFEMRVRTEGMWRAEATGGLAPTLLAMEARRARSEEAQLRQAVEIEKARSEEYLKTIGQLRERTKELESTLEHISKHGYGGGA